MVFGPFYVNDKPAATGIEVQIDSTGTDAPLDGATATARLTYPDGHTLALDAMINDNYLVVNWPLTSPFSMPGAYVLQARLNTDSTSQTISPIGFVVLDAVGVQSSWVNAGDVARATGKSVTNEVIVQAQIQIEVMTRVLSSQAYLYGAVIQPGQTLAIGAGDSQLLKLAVAYQAAWITSQPDLFDRMDVSSFSQDGLSANVNAGGMIVSPHARQVMKRLTWMGSRSVTMTPSAYNARNVVDALDDSLAWRPL